MKFNTMQKYIVGIESRIIWTGEASTGINALHEAYEKYPNEDKELFWVEAA